MHIDRLREESLNHSKDKAAKIDKYLYGDDNELKESELVQGIDVSKFYDKK
jgi:hypothetical protein